MPDRHRSAVRRRATAADAEALRRAIELDLDAARRGNRAAPPEHAEQSPCRDAGSRPLAAEPAEPEADSRR